MSEYTGSPMLNRLSNINGNTKNSTISKSIANNSKYNESPNPAKIHEVQQKFMKIITNQDNERLKKAKNIESFITTLEKEISLNSQFEGQLKVILKGI